MKKPLRRSKLIWLQQALKERRTLVFLAGSKRKKIKVQEPEKDDINITIELDSKDNIKDSCKLIFNDKYYQKKAFLKKMYYKVNLISCKIKQER